MADTKLGGLESFSGVNPLNDSEKETIETYPVVWAGDLPIIYAARRSHTSLPLGFGPSRHLAALNFMQVRWGR